MKQTIKDIYSELKLILFVCMAFFAGYCYGMFKVGDLALKHMDNDRRYQDSVIIILKDRLND